MRFIEILLDIIYIEISFVFSVIIYLKWTISFKETWVSIIEIII